MKILILGDASNPHIIKWSNALSAANQEVYLFSLSQERVGQLEKEINIIKWEVSDDLKNSGNGQFRKMMYLGALPALRKYIRLIKPDILHAHYATSYGFLGALSNFHPYVVSVWGMDVFQFPQKSIIHRMLLQYNFIKADRILSTSNIMAKEVKKYTTKEVIVTPFGIDLKRFKPGERFNLFSSNDIVIGTIKTLEEKYGIHYLIDAFCMARSKLKNESLKLLIVGGGSLYENIKDYLNIKGIMNDSILTGFIDYSEVHRYHNSLDIYLALSVFDDESFGVAILEASASEVPVIVSNIGGLPEVVLNGKTGFIVPARDAELASDKIIELVKNFKLRKEMGKAGRDYVKEYFNLENNVKQMLNLYNQL